MPSPPKVNANPLLIPGNVLSIQNLPDDIRCSEIETLFTKFGEIQEISVIWKKDQDLQARLQFKEEEEAAEAKEKLDQLKIDEKVVNIEIL